MEGQRDGVEMELETEIRGEVGVEQRQRQIQPAEQPLPSDGGHPSGEGVENGKGYPGSALPRLGPP